jgi:K+-transporting ATPase ATPase C chain
MKIIFPCFRLFLVLVFLTGIVYPLIVTGLAQVLFHDQAQGSILTVNGHTIGSVLLAQKTENARYFWPRPSADDYATVASGASNLGPSSDALKKADADRVSKLDTAFSLPAGTSIPGDFISSSASGLDPEISPEAARLQLDHVAQARGFSAEQKSELEELLKKQIRGPQLGFLGEPRVNVLLLNVATDQIK